MLRSTRHRVKTDSGSCIAALNSSNHAALPPGRHEALTVVPENPAAADKLQQAFTAWLRAGHRYPAEPLEREVFMSRIQGTATRRDASSTACFVRCLTIGVLAVGISGAHADGTRARSSADLATGSAHAQGMAATPRSHGVYRLPFADGTQVKVFDDFTTHRPRGRVDLYAIAGKKPYRVVAAAAGRIVAIQDGYDEQQSGRAAALCHNNYVWIAHPNGEWTNYSHVARGSVTGKAHLEVGDQVAAGQYIGDEGAVGCAMLQHVHFEVAAPDPAHPIDSGGFLTDNDNGKRELNPRFCGVPARNAVKGKAYVAAPCG